MHRMKNFNLNAIVALCFVTYVRAIELQIFQACAPEGKWAVSSNKFNFKKPICPDAVSNSSFFRVDSFEFSTSLSFGMPSSPYLAFRNCESEAEPELIFEDSVLDREEAMQFVRSAKSIVLPPGDLLFEALDRMFPIERSRMMGVTVSHDAKVSIYLGRYAQGAEISLHSNGSAPLEAMRSPLNMRVSGEKTYPLIRKLEIGSTLILSDLIDPSLKGELALRLLSEKGYNPEESARGWASIKDALVKDKSQLSEDTFRRIEAEHNLLRHGYTYTHAFVEAVNKYFANRAYFGSLYCCQANLIALYRVS